MMINTLLVSPPTVRGCLVPQHDGVVNLSKLRSTEISKSVNFDE